MQGKCRFSYPPSPIVQRTDAVSLSGSSLQWRSRCRVRATWHFSQTSSKPVLTAYMRSLAPAKWEKKKKDKEEKFMQSAKGDFNQLVRCNCDVMTYSEVADYAVSVDRGEAGYPWRCDCRAVSPSLITSPQRG